MVGKRSLGMGSLWFGYLGFSYLDGILEFGDLFGVVRSIQVLCFV